MRVFYTAVDCGDGSCNVEFYESQECIDLLEEHDPECYRGEGGGWFDVESISGISITTLDEVKANVEEDEDFDDLED